MPGFPIVSLDSCRLRGPHPRPSERWDPTFRSMCTGVAMPRVDIVVVCAIRCRATSCHVTRQLRTLADPWMSSPTSTPLGGLAGGVDPCGAPQESLGVECAQPTRHTAPPMSSCPYRSILASRRRGEPVVTRPGSRLSRHPAHREAARTERCRPSACVVLPDPIEVSAQAPWDGVADGLPSSIVRACSMPVRARRTRLAGWCRRRPRDLAVHTALARTSPALRVRRMRSRP